MLLLLGAAVLYAGGGILYARSKGQKEHPHMRNFRNFNGLVADGVSFTLSGFRARNKGPLQEGLAGANDGANAVADAGVLVGQIHVN